jgi:hypothetical protein
VYVQMNVDTKLQEVSRRYVRLESDRVSAPYKVTSSFSFLLDNSACAEHHSVVKPTNQLVDEGEDFNLRVLQP